MAKSDNQAGGGAKQYSMTVGAMTILTVAAVISLRNLPSMAEYGWAIIFILVIACLAFFIPSALVSAELASTFTENGGVYAWVREAFGPRWGFVAIFMQWAENVPWFPAVLTFLAEAVAFVFNPDLATNKWFVFILVVALLWLATFLNFKGMRLSVFLSNSGALLGTLIPGVLVIVLVGVYLFRGDPIQIPFDNGAALLPDMSNPTDLMLLVGMLVALSGMEMSAVHVLDMKNPKKNFPKAIFMAAGIAIILSVLGALAIAFVVPPMQLSLAAGVPQAFEAVFNALNLSFLTPIVCILLAYGAFTMVVTWVLGPSKGMLQVAEEGYLPTKLRKRNAQGMPVSILIVQGILSTLIATCILFMPTISSAFWLTTALTGQLYLIMYILMFAAAIKLRYSKPNVERPYKVPGGKFGIWLVAGIALLACVLSIVVGFIPTSSVLAEGPAMTIGYVLFLLVTTVVLVFVPMLFYKLSKTHNWKATAAELAANGESAPESVQAAPDNAQSAPAQTDNAEADKAADATNKSIDQATSAASSNDKQAPPDATAATPPQPSESAPPDDSAPNKEPAQEDQEAPKSTREKLVEAEAFEAKAAEAVEEAKIEEIKAAEKVIEAAEEVIEKDKE